MLWPVIRSALHFAGRRSAKIVPEMICNFSLSSPLSHSLNSESFPDGYDAKIAERWSTPLMHAFHYGKGSMASMVLPERHQRMSPLFPR